MQRILEEGQVKISESIQSKEYQARRQRLLEQLPSGSITIVCGAKTCYRNYDSEYPFRQNSDFYYLCGFSEPNALLVLLKPGNTKAAEEFILFCNPCHPDEERWTGKRAGTEGAITHYGASRAYGIQELDVIMPSLMSDKTQCFYTLGIDRKFDDRLFTWIEAARSKTRKGGEYPRIWQDIAPLIHEMRLIKSQAEIELMKKAADISVAAHLRLMKSCHPGIMEYHLEADFIHESLRQGARALAYPSIVGSGNNSCILHYTANNETLTDGSMVLIDAGCEYQNYASDITRTYPVNGRFSKEQKAIYELVLKAQQAAIEIVQPKTPWDALQKRILEVLVQGLVDLKILQGSVKQLIEEQAFLPFYMHSSGHWLGLDVHDAGAYKINGEWRPLEPGMVLTVEPGLYISEGSATDKKWWGIGIRIEDDVLVTKNGHEILTAGLPKTVEEIEKVMSQHAK